MSCLTATIEYVVRVKLPVFDKENERAYNQSIFDSKPIGFEVSWTSRDMWPIDKDGFTWVRLFCTDQRMAVEYFLSKIDSLRKQVERLQQQKGTNV